MQEQLNQTVKQKQQLAAANRQPLLLDRNQQPRNRRILKQSQPAEYTNSNDGYNRYTGHKDKYEDDEDN